MGRNLMRATLCRFILCKGLLLSAFTQLASQPASTATPRQREAFTVTAKVDQRVELMSIVSRLAGYEEYVQNDFKLHENVVDRHFDTYKRHPAVKFAKKIDGSIQVGHDAVMKMAVHLSSPPSLTPRVAFTEQVPDGRWGPATTNVQYWLARSKWKLMYQRTNRTKKLKPEVAANILEVNEGNFEREVLNSAQPFLLFFWAGWCTPCPDVEAVLVGIARDYHSKVRAGKLNADENQKLAGQYRVRGIPTLILFAGGVEKSRILPTTEASFVAGVTETRSKQKRIYRDVIVRRLLSD